MRTYDTDGSRLKIATNLALVGKFTVDHDLVKTHKKYGILCFEHYCGVVLRRDGVFFVFSVSLQNSPTGMYRISCPAIIHAGPLNEFQRLVLWSKLNAARDSIPQKHWQMSGMKTEDRFLVLKE